MVPIKQIALFFVAVHALLCLSLPAQDLNFYQYTVDNGLPSSQVHDIIQDKYGRLWFATDCGLACYNGYAFRNYSTADGLTDNTVFKFFHHAADEIWCTTFNKSVFCISGSTPVFTPYRFNKTLVDISDGYIANCLHLSADGSLFLSVVGGSGYIHLDAKGKIVRSTLNARIDDLYETCILAEPDKPDFFWLSKAGDKEKIPGNWNKITWSGQNNTGQEYIKACFFENSGHAVFTNARGIQVMLRNGDTVNVPAQFEPISLGKLNDSLFWVGFRYGGVAICNLDGKLLNTFLEGRSVTRLFIDHEGGYWLSTLSDGVFYARNAEVKCNSSPGLKNSWISSLEKDAAGRLWVGHYNGNVSVLCAGKPVEAYSSGRKKPSRLFYDSCARKIYFMSDGKLFTGGEPGNPCRIIHGDASNFYVHRHDSVLLASYRGIAILCRDKQTSIYTGWRVTDICFHRDKFYLSSNKGLYVLKGQGTEPALPKGLISSAAITDLCAWKDMLLLATKGAGVLMLKGGNVYQADKKNGLSDNLVNKVCAESDTVFWACTNRGLNRVVFRNNTVCSVDIISYNNGLVSDEVTDVEIMNDSVWVSTRRGLCVFPASLLKNKQENINYHLGINQFKVNDKVLAPANGMELKYDQNRIEFGFSAVSFSKHQPLVYRYRLEGLETRWNYTKALSTVYSSLPPGAYTFIVQVRGSNNTWDKGEQKYSFTVLSPWWKTAWFFSAVTVSAAGFVYLFFKFRILSYNRDITRELLRQLLKRIRKKANYVVLREQGKDLRIDSTTICYVKADGNYIEIHTDTKRHVIRYKIGEFLDLTPDPLEYLRINRSYIIRLDKVQEKNKKEVTVRGEKIPVGETYLDQLQKIKF